MLPAYPPAAFDPTQPFNYNPYGYGVSFTTAYGAPPSMHPGIQACTISPFYDSAHSKSSSPACSKSESESSLDCSDEYRKKREKRDRNNEAARSSRLRRKARESRLAKEAEVLQKENQVLRDEVGELKKVFYSLQEEASCRRVTGDVAGNFTIYQNIGFPYEEKVL
ncbi:unnamed protein product [Cylicocyclus nassatus]|uniref:BZIP domain-containing protein n=1 Tax=Cylicocyclus nassatus TaxID=53992 RepID=A0AA36M3J2_CYLNA|nr:unnamed protein product [Cylicocyclus nassatus]